MPLIENLVHNEEGVCAKMQISILVRKWGYTLAPLMLSEHTLVLSSSVIYLCIVKYSPNVLIYTKWGERVEYWANLVCNHNISHYIQWGIQVLPVKNWPGCLLPSQHSDTSIIAGSLYVHHGTMSTSYVPSYLDCTLLQNQQKCHLFVWWCDEEGDMKWALLVSPIDTDM